MTRLSIKQSPGSSAGHSHDDRTRVSGLCGVGTLTQVGDADCTLGTGTETPDWSEPEGCRF